MAEKTREAKEKFVPSSTAQGERLEWDENRKKGKLYKMCFFFFFLSMDWENLYSLQRHRKIPVGSLIQHDDLFFLEREKEKKPSSKNPCFYHA